MLPRFSNFTDEQLEEMLESLVEQMAGGKAAISYNGQSITFSSITNIMTAVESIERELTRRRAAANGLKKKTGARYTRLPGKGF